MRITQTVTIVTLMAACGAVSTFGQSVISAKAGVIHYTEGDVNIASGKVIEPMEARSGGKYTDLKEGQALGTAEGRAEILLNPGVFFRIGENSSVKMISSRLSDTRLDLTRGVALVEVAEVSKENAVTILVKDAAVTFSKMALVRLDVENGIKVFKGEAQVMTGGTPQILREGREMQFQAGNAVVKFDAKQGDPLYRWANRRAEYIAMANIASAKMARSSFNGMNGSINPMQGGWFYNSFYGMMTYLPLGNGLYRSPFGYMYYTPQRVARYYSNYVQAQTPVGGGTMAAGGGSNGRAWNSDNGYYTTQSRSAGPVSMPAGGGGGAPAAAASAPPAARGADAGTGRGGGSGGRTQ
jgi:hypothetical protein